MSKPTWQMNSHEIAKTCYEEGDWRVMQGPKPAYEKVSHFFLHHDCDKINKDGYTHWMSWYATVKDRALPWCSYCDSEPSDELLGLALLVENGQR